MGMSLSGLGALCLVFVGFGFTCLPAKVRIEQPKDNDEDISCFR